MKSPSLIALCVLGTACAGSPAPTTQVADALAAVRGAEEAGAADLPQAALHLQLAEEELAKARKLMDDEKNADAKRMAARARQDAELALALAHQQQAKQALESFESKPPSAGGEQPEQHAAGEPAGSMAPVR